MLEDLLADVGELQDSVAGVAENTAQGKSLMKHRGEKVGVKEHSKISVHTTDSWKEGGWKME